MNDQTRTAQSDRDPADPQACGQAVSKWLDAYSSENEGETSPDEADIALEAALLAQGVLNPADSANGMYFQRNSGGEHRVVHIQLGDGDWLEVTPQGTVTLL